MNTNDEYESATNIAKRVRAGEASAEEVVSRSLGRAEAVDGNIRSLTTVVGERALAEAKSIDDRVAAGETVGPLAGVPFVAKDLEWAEGVRTTMGSKVFEDFVPTEDSIAVKRLREAGAILIGKSNTCEFGMQLETTNRIGPDTRNPWDVSRTTGGSSGGSAAAVAAGIVPIATGSDSAGSIGNPSAFCGVVGVKPSHGRIPQWPNTNDSHLLLDTGCISRQVDDNALMLEVMAGDDPRDPVSIREELPDVLGACQRDPGSLRIATSDSYSGWPVDSEVLEAFKAASALLSDLGHSVTKDEPAVEGAHLDTYMPLYLADVHVALDSLLSERPSELDDQTRGALSDARNVTIADYVLARHRLLEMQRVVGDFFLDYDLFVTPNNLVPAFPALEPPRDIAGVPVPRDWRPHLSFLTPWNLAGNPWIAIPGGRSSGGLPVGLLLVARMGNEELLYSVASTIERERPWNDDWPQI